MPLVVKIKAIGADRTWLGQLVLQDTYYEIPAPRVISWATDQNVRNDLLAGNALINDGTIDITDFANQIRFVKSFLALPGVVSGTEDPLVTPIYGYKGWFYFQYGDGAGKIFKKLDDGVTTNWIESDVTFS